MSQPVQMDFNFDEPIEMGAFVKLLKEKKIPEADLYGKIDGVTNHFEEVKTKELIHELMQLFEVKELPAVPEITSTRHDEKRLLNQIKAERIRQRKAKYPPSVVFLP